MRHFVSFLTITALMFATTAGVSAQAMVDAEPINLFESKNIADWDYHLIDGGVKTEVFSFTPDGTLLCTGLPYGWLCTKESYTNFKLTLEYRWPEGVTPTNSGVFVRMRPAPAGAFVPKGFEVQLAHGSAGDIWAFHGATLQGPRFREVLNHATIGNFQGVRRLVSNENEPGQWNTISILCADGMIVVSLNGKIVNWTTDADREAGPIGLQSEGGPIEFRNMMLTVLP